jgi:ubiquinone/menaquinone biosynthesis C-methylase UbiE
VLDIGAGVGGPARRWAGQYGVRVWGVELSEEVYRTAIALTALVRLQDQVQFAHGSALALPFEAAAFDVVVMQHVAMQIAEKDQLFAECVRVLATDGVVALHEIFAGPGGPPLFPLAWAVDPTMSSLESWGTCSRRLTQIGLTVGPFVDHSEAGRQYHAANINAWQKALAEECGAQGRSIEATEARLRAAISMERNLRECRLQVGMVACAKRPT